MRHHVKYQSILGWIFFVSSLVLLKSLRVFFLGDIFHGKLFPRKFSKGFISGQFFSLRSFWSISFLKKQMNIYQKEIQWLLVSLEWRHFAGVVPSHFVGVILGWKWLLGSFIKDSLNSMNAHLAIYHSCTIHPNVFFIFSENLCLR